MADETLKISSKKVPGIICLILSICLILLPAVLSAPAYASPTVAQEESGTVQVSALVDTQLINEEMEEIAERYSGSYGMYLKVLGTGEEAGYRPDRAFTAASCYKLFQVMYLYESAAAGNVDLEREIVYQSGDHSGGTGIVQHMPTGTALTTRELCGYAIIYSDNVAANMLRRTYGYVPYRDYATSIGCPVTGQYGQNLTTAREMCIVLERVWQFAESDPLGNEVIRYLRDSIYNSRIPAGLPEGVKVGNKTGDDSGYCNDAAIIMLNDVTYVLSVLSFAPAGNFVHAKVSEAVYGNIARRGWPGGHCAMGATQPANQWYFAEGNTLPEFDEYICLQNTESEEVSVQLNFMLETGEVMTYTVFVGPHTRNTYNLKEFVGEGHHVSTHVQLDSPAIIAERPMYFNYKEGSLEYDWRGGHASTGQNELQNEYYFAEGTTRRSESEGEFEEWICLMNPLDERATVGITYMLGDGSRIEKYYALGPHSRRNVDVAGDVGLDQDVSAMVTSDVPIAAERPQYFDYQGRVGGHVQAAIAQTSRSWYFPEGYTGGEFDTYILAQNPGGSAATVKYTYMKTTGEKVERSARVEPHSRFTVSVDNIPELASCEFSTEVTSDRPIICERSMYFSFDGKTGGHDVAGAISPSSTWYFAEGCTAMDFETYILVQNPGDETAQVKATFMKPDGKTVEETYAVGPGSRYTIKVNDIDGLESADMSARIETTNDTEVVAERAMYFFYQHAYP